MSGSDGATENPHAGTSAVVLDIGGDVGAVIVTAPASMIDEEVEIVPAGTARVARTGQHAHVHADGPTPVLVGEPGAPTPHVAVVDRPLPDGRRVPTLVFGAVLAGRYDLYVKPDGPVALTVDVAGGQVTEARWPD